MEQCSYDRDMVYFDFVLLFHLSAVCGGNAARNVAIHWQRQERKRPLASKQAKFKQSMPTYVQNHFFFFFLNFL